jgi:hypothetical protein
VPDLERAIAEYQGRVRRFGGRPEEAQPLELTS